MSAFRVATYKREPGLFYVLEAHPGGGDEPVRAFTRRATAEACRAHFEHCSSNTETPCEACVRSIFDCAAPPCATAVELARAFEAERKLEPKP